MTLKNQKETKINKWSYAIVDTNTILLSLCLTYRPTTRLTVDTILRVESCNFVSGEHCPPPLWEVLTGQNRTVLTCIDLQNCHAVFCFYCFLVLFYYLLSTLLTAEYCLCWLTSIVGAIYVTVVCSISGHLRVTFEVWYDRNTCHQLMVCECKFFSLS